MVTGSLLNALHRSILKTLNLIFDFKLQHWVISMLSICKDFNRSLYLQEV